MKRLSHFCTVLLMIFSFSGCDSNKQATPQFTLGDSDFLIDGKPFLMISGEMHYPRIPKEYWRERMRMAKAMGLNTIGTYVFWNVHEPQPGVFDFSGDHDVAGFVKAAKDEGLWVVLRPSPYVCAEWEFGGYPWWLLRDSSVQVRSKDPKFIDAYTRYIRELSKQLVPLLVTNGGNILMVQIENEYGSYSNDKTYMDLNRRIFEEAGFTCELFTCDGADKMENGYLPGYLPAVNGLEDTAEVKKRVNKFHEGKGPYYVAEWYPGWFDQWGKKHAQVSAEANAEKLDRILAAGISINMYMFHGGSTRGFMNGANMNYNEPYAPQVSSYDYDAPLDEAGNPTAKFYRFRSVIEKYIPRGASLPEAPEVKTAMRIDSIVLSEEASVFSNLPAAVVSPAPLPFEDLGQGYGFALYESVIKTGGSGWLKVGGLRDFALVYVNGLQMGVLDRRLNLDSLRLTNLPPGSKLSLWVENNGRINYGPFLTNNRKGITGEVSFDGVTIIDWKIYPFPFQDLAGIKFLPRGEEKRAPGPRLVRGYFSLTDTADCYLDMRPFGKGFVFLNGHHLGKYWEIGPQQTLYVPGCWLKKGVNELVVFDALKEAPAAMQAIDKPILDKLIF